MDSICLQVMAGDHRRSPFHTGGGALFTLDAYPGHGYCNDLVSFRLARALGCVFKHTECLEYSYLTYHPLPVHSVTTLNVKTRGSFALMPYWVPIVAIVISHLEHPGMCESDIILS